MRGGGNRSACHGGYIVQGLFQSEAFHRQDNQIKVAVKGIGARQLRLDHFCTRGGLAPARFAAHPDACRQKYYGG